MDPAWQHSRRPESELPRDFMIRDIPGPLSATKRVGGQNGGQRNQNHTTFSSRRLTLGKEETTIVEGSRSPQIRELRFAVVGARETGKSTFIRCTLDLKKHTSTSVFASKKMSFEGQVFSISLLEIEIDEVDVLENYNITWPAKIRDLDGLPIDGVLALYDVTQQSSISSIPTLLSELLQHLGQLPFRTC